MELNYLKISETTFIIALYFILKAVFYKIVDKTIINRLIHNSRSTIIKRTLNLILLGVCATILLLIWGVKQSELAVFVGSILTVVGVALFAQWSLLSNMTSSIIIFFSHSVKLNDSIMILEGKDYIIEGKVTNIGLFFVTLETNNKEEITLPNNIFIQKSIRKKNPSNLRSTEEQSNSLVE